MARKAKLAIKKTRKNERRETEFFVGLWASNGETLGIGETHATTVLAEDSRQAWLRAMVDVLEAEGCVVTLPSTISFPWAKDQWKNA